LTSFFRAKSGFIEEKGLKNGLTASRKISYSSGFKAARQRGLKAARCSFYPEKVQTGFPRITAFCFAVRLFGFVLI
jgi:hypothetical protein